MVKRLLALALLSSCPQPGQGSYFAHPYANTVATAPTPKALPPPRPTSDGSLLGDCRKAIANAKALEGSILAFKGVRAVDNTVEPYNEIERQLGAAGAWADVIAATDGNAKMRDAAHTCSAELAHAWSELWLDHRIYDALKSVDTSLADVETKRFVAAVVRDMKRTGVELEDKGRARLQEIDGHLAALTRDFQQNLAADVRTVTVTDAARLGGLPADWIAAHKPDASGAIKITTDFGDYIPVLTYADDDALRKELYTAFRSRGDKNEQVIRDLLALRAEKALLLGFTSWADFASDANMLRGGKAALDFVDRIQRIAAPRAKKDYGELLAQLKKKDPKATEVGEWQKAYLENQLRHDKYALDPAEIRKYFGHDKTVVGILELAQTSFDVELTPASDPRAWGADVKVYDVSRKGERLGRLFVDTHARPRKVALGVRALAVPNKQSEVVLVMNLPADLEHRDVVAMFHEFGKAMHALLGGRHHFVRQSGLPSELDFADAAAQAFEDNAWSDDGLGKLGVPKDVADKLRRADRFGKGTWVTTQLLYAAVALRFHIDDASKLDQAAVWKQLQKKYVPFAFVDATKPQLSFEHLATYSSLYVTYLWSFVLARDLASSGKPLSSLADAGGTKDAADLVKDYLGRANGTKAFEKYLGEPY